MARKIDDLFLTKLSRRELESKQMNILRGGVRVCTCSCAYANSGGSSSESNRSANYDLGGNGGYSTSGCNQYGQLEVGGSYVTGYCPECTA